MERSMNLHMIWPALLILLLGINPLYAEQNSRKQNTRGEIDIEQVTKAFFAKLPDRQPGDIVSQADVKQLLKALNSKGWQVPGEAQLLDKVPSDGELLVRTLRSPEGLKFMRKVSGNALIYDRLDRISRESGGPQLISGLIKLPDGEKYSNTKLPRGVPNLLDLLPKNASGKTRTIKDYDKPTGRIYTVDQLVEQLREREQASKDKPRSGSATGKTSTASPTKNRQP